MWKILCLVVVTALMLFGGESHAGIYQISSSEDSWVYSYQPDTKFGSDPSLGTAIQFMSPRGYTFLKFNIPTLTNEIILSATLYLYQFNGGGYGEGPTAIVLLPDNSWSENAITWNNAPTGYGTFLAASADGHSHVGWSSWSFSWDSSYGSTITLRIGENSSGDQSHNWYSKEYGSLEPRLEIITSPYFVTSTDKVTVPEGGMAAFLVRLSAQPSMTVTVTVTPFSGDSDIDVHSGSFLTFTASDWATDQAVTLQALKDADTDNGSTVIRLSALGIPNKDVTGTEADTTAPIFDDVAVENFAYQFINAIYNFQITAGCQMNPLMYCPEDAVTREQMAVFITRAMDEVPLDGYCDTTDPFSDVSFNRWSCKYIKKLEELDITSGYGDGRFGPGDSVTREQMAVFLTRALNQIPADGYCGTTGPFTDVPYDWWSCKYVKMLLDLGITTGYGDGRFGPDDYVTRAQMAVFLSRAFLGM